MVSWLRELSDEPSRPPASMGEDEGNDRGDVGRTKKNGASCYSYVKEDAEGVSNTTEVQVGWTREYKTKGDAGE